MASSQSLVKSDDKFPDDFLFGVGTSAYQIEGGHDAEGKGETMWDHHLRRNPSLAHDSTNGDVTCDSYHRYRDDIAILADLGVDFYRFSISWSRILPTGYPNRINPDGLRYYNDLIDGLLARKIRPMVTMHHLDLPKPIQDLGGWTNAVVSDLFVDYAGILFANFGDRVKLWTTVSVNWSGYGDGEWPPLIDQRGVGEYLYVKNILLAHARAYRLYHEKFAGQMGLTIDGRWYEPGSDSPQDSEAAQRARQFYLGLIAHPLYHGDFPPLVRQRVDQLSRRQGFPRSRLPRLSQSDIETIKGSCDFLGLNAFTTYLVKNIDDAGSNEPSFTNDVRVELYQDPSWPGSGSSWLKVVPRGLRGVLNWVKTTYENPPIIITENGVSDKGAIDDVDRVDYLQKHLRALLDSIQQDGVQVKAYGVWSLLDNFEWLAGYSEKFGLYHVDFEDPHRKRTPKASAKWYRNFLKRRQLDQVL